MIPSQEHPSLKAHVSRSKNSHVDIHVRVKVKIDCISFYGNGMYDCS